MEGGESLPASVYVGFYFRRLLAAVASFTSSACRLVGRHLFIFFFLFLYDVSSLEMCTDSSGFQILCELWSFTFEAKHQ